MNINYDRVADAMYLILSEDKVSKTVGVTDKINIDLNSKGETIGIELLEVSTQQSELEKYIAQGIPVNLVQSTPVSI